MDCNASSLEPHGSRSRHSIQSQIQFGDSCQQCWSQCRIMTDLQTIQLTLLLVTFSIDKLSTLLPRPNRLKSIDESNPIIPTIGVQWDYRKMTTNVVLFYSWWTIRWQGGVIQVPTTQVLLPHNKTQQVLVFILVLIFQFHSATVVPFAGNVTHVSFEEEGWCADVRLAQVLVPSRRTPFCWLDVSFSSSCHTVRQDIKTASCNQQHVCQFTRIQNSVLLLVFKKYCCVGDQLARFGDRQTKSQILVCRNRKSVCRASSVDTSSDSKYLLWVEVHGLIRAAH